MIVAKDVGPTTTRIAATNERPMMMTIAATDGGPTMATTAVIDEGLMMMMTEKERDEKKRGNASGSAGDKSNGIVEGKDERRNALPKRLQLRRMRPEV
jgi:hypothetical protein